MSTDLDTWWEHLRATALVGTARRDVPPVPDLGTQPPDGAGREQALLEAAALGDAVRRAGRLADPAPDSAEPAPAESLPVAPSPATQILELLLTQGPVGPAARATLTVHWLRTAAAAGRIVPPRLLPALLDASTSGSLVRAAVRPVLGERGVWLAAQNPAWDWALCGAGRCRRLRRGVRARIQGAGWEADVGARIAPSPSPRWPWASVPTTNRSSSGASTTVPARCARRPSGSWTACPGRPGPLGWPPGSGR